MATESTSTDSTDSTDSTEADKTATKGGSVLVRSIVLVSVLSVFAFSAYYFTRPKDTPFTRAVAQIQQGKAARAIPVLEEMVREHPDNPELYPWLAQGYLAAQRYAEGRTALDTALRLKLPAKHLFPVVQSYAEFYMRRGDFDEAEKLYLSSNRIGQPKYFDAERAKMYLSWSDKDISQMNYRDGIHHLQLADSLSQGMEESLKATIPHKLASCYRRLAAICEVEENNDKEAIQLLEKSLSVSDEPLTRMALAAIYTRLGKTQKAIENYEAVSQEDPNNLEVRHHLIELLLEKKDFEKAQEALADLTDKERSVENFELLAELNLKIGNYAGAVRALEEATSLRATPELLRKLRDTLLSWHDLLISERKLQEATSVKGHAERVSEQLALLAPDEEKESTGEGDKMWDPKGSPVAIVFARTWLEKGSLTPEGKIKIRNVTGQNISELSLTAVFYDNTSRRRAGKIELPVASEARPFPPGEEKWLYFSSPHTIRPDHQLAVIILWNGRFLREFPVVKRSR